MLVIGGQSTIPEAVRQGAGAAWLWKGRPCTKTSSFPFGADLIARAGSMALEYFGRVSTLAANRKSRQDVVTEADVAVEN